MKRRKKTLAQAPGICTLVMLMWLNPAVPEALATGNPDDPTSGGKFPLVEGIIYEQIEQMEYSISWQPDFNAYMAPNRQQNHRFTFHHNGFTVTQREFQEDDLRWSATLQWDSYGRPLHQASPSQEVAWLVDGAQAEAQSEATSIFYTNSKEGLRQDFLIRNRPEGVGPLRLDFTVTAPGLSIAVTPDGQAVEFLDPGEHCFGSILRSARF